MPEQPYFPIRSLRLCLFENQRGEKLNKRVSKTSIWLNNLCLEILIIKHCFVCETVFQKRVDTDIEN